MAGIAVAMEYQKLNFVAVDYVLAARSGLEAITASTALNQLSGVTRPQKPLIRPSTSFISFSSLPCVHR